MKFIINNSYTQVVDCLAQALEQIADWCKVNYSYWGQDWTFKPPRKIIRNKSIYYLNQDGFFPTGWAGKFIKELNEQGHSIKIQDERRKPNYTIRFLGDETIKLRDYQREALEAALKTKRGIIHHATGSGKTINAAAIIKAISVQALVIVPDINLLDQTAHELERFLGEDCMGKIGNSLWKPNHVTVSTIQTLGSRLRTNPIKVKSFLKNIDLLVLDEAHHVNITGVKKPGKKKAGTPKPNTQYYEISMLTNAYYRFGLTATPGSPNKIERRLLEGVTGKVLHHVSSSYLIERGYLTQPIIQMYKSEVPPYKEWKDAQKHNIIENIHRNLFISKLAQGYAKQGKSVLITVDRIRHGNDLCEMLDEEAIFLSGKDDAEYRKTIFEDFKNKDLYILVSTIVREGVDIPSMDVIIRAEGGKSDRVTIQKMGRVLRKAEGKDKARIIDFYDDDGTKVSGTDNILRKHSKARLREYKREAAFDVQPLIDIPEIK